VQGDVAVASILEALQEIEKCQEQFDVVVLVRGGGAEVGLTCYNNYELCKGIATFPLPILTGIGHSTNLTVAELIAYASAITPTQLAEMLIAQFREFELRIERLSQGVVQHAQMQIQRNGDKINQVVQNLNWASNQYFKAKQLELEHALQKINLLDPIHILNRGFTITTIDGTLLKNISELENGQVMQTQTNEALIYSKIEKPNQN
jgi:exodeoxyribonuclease VII large subunit